MKFFVAFAMLVAVASAAVIRPTLVSGDIAQIQQIIEAINSPSTNPDSVAALEQMLQDLLGVENIVVEGSPISVGPAIVEAGDISVGPAIIDFPLPDGGAVSAPVEVSPVVVGPVVDSAAGPVVQIIINVKAPSSAGVGPEPVQIVDNSVVGVVPEAVQIVDQVAEPVQIVDQVVEPVHIVDSIVEPVQIVDVAPVVVEPIHVVDLPPVVVEPVQIGAPIIAAPAVNLPDILN